ncbi:MAG: tetratricopeptide repeat protein [Myxococcaceae bacterium]|nr:tetratricopeptide repeat protein [Myxococcaceae bacterium]
MRRAALAIALVLAGCSKSTANTHLELARDAVFKHQPQRALEEYRLVLDAVEHDESPEGVLARARALRGAGDVYYLELREYRRAVEVYRELTTLCPEAPPTLEGRIRLADLLEHELRDLRGAIAELTAALARNPPQSAELAYRVSRLYFEIGDYQQCELETASLARKYETSPLVDDALFLRGQALAMIDERHADAMRAFQELLERFPDSELQPHALFELGKLKADAGDGEKAIGLWIAALKKHPDPGVVQTFISRVRRHLRNTTPEEVGERAKAFDRDVPQVAARLPKSSIEAVGGSADEAAREARMSPEAAAHPGAKDAKALPESGQ